MALGGTEDSGIEGLPPERLVVLFNHAYVRQSEIEALRHTQDQEDPLSGLPIYLQLEHEQAKSEHQIITDYIENRDFDSATLHLFAINFKDKFLRLSTAERFLDCSYQPTDVTNHICDVVKQFYHPPLDLKELAIKGISSQELDYLFRCRQVAIEATHKLMKHPDIGTINISYLLPIPDEIGRILRVYMPTLPADIAKDIDPWIKKTGYKPPVRIPAARRLGKTALPVFEQYTLAA